MQYVQCALSHTYISIVNTWYNGSVVGGGNALGMDGWTWDGRAHTF